MVLDLLHTNKIVCQKNKGRLLYKAAHLVPQNKDPVGIYPVFTSPTGTGVFKKNMQEKGSLASFYILVQTTG